MTEILEGERVGIAIPDFSDDSLRTGVSRLFRLLEDEDVSKRCVTTAHKHFSLERGVELYSQVYESLGLAR